MTQSFFYYTYENNITMLHKPLLVLTLLFLLIYKAQSQERYCEETGVTLSSQTLTDTITISFNNNETDSLAFEIYSRWGSLIYKPFEKGTFPENHSITLIRDSTSWCADGFCQQTGAYAVFLSKNDSVSTKYIFVADDETITSTYEIHSSNKKASITVSGETLLIPKTIRWTALKILDTQSRTRFESKKTETVRLPQLQTGYYVTLLITTTGTLKQRILIN